jgi:hypothetical protein
MVSKIFFKKKSSKPKYQQTKTRVDSLSVGGLGIYLLLEIYTEIIHVERADTIVGRGSWSSFCRINLFCGRFFSKKKNGKKKRRLKLRAAVRAMNGEK